jgi:hypothetical protein
VRQKFREGDRVEHRDGSRGTIIDVLGETRPRNPDYVIIWDEHWDLKDPSEKGICDFCLGRYLKLEPPTKRENLIEAVDYDS